MIIKHAMEDIGFEPMTLDHHSNVYLRTKLIFLAPGFYGHYNSF